MSALYILYKNKTNNQTKNIVDNYRFYLKSLNNSKQIDLLNNNAICTQLQDCYIVYFERNKELQKRAKYKIEIYTRKNVKINYENIQNNIDKSFTSRDWYNVDKYLFEQINVKINNKYKIAHCKRDYNKNNTTYLRQFNFEKKSKIKITQNIFIIETKVNNNNIK